MISLVSVSDSASGICLFERRWGVWHGEQATEAVCSLIQVFYQFAGEIDDGEIAKVLFKPAMQVGTQAARPHPIPAVSFRSKSRARHESLGLCCERAERFTVAVFYVDLTDGEDPPKLEPIRAFARRIKEAFNDLHCVELRDLEPELREHGSADNVDPDILHDILQKFVAFSPALDKLQTGVVVPPAEHSDAHARPRRSRASPNQMPQRTPSAGPDILNVDDVVFDENSADTPEPRVRLGGTQQPAAILDESSIEDSINDENAPLTTQFPHSSAPISVSQKSGEEVFAEAEAEAAAAEAEAAKPLI